MGSCVLECKVDCSCRTVTVAEPNAVQRVFGALKDLYDATTRAGVRATEYWADIAVNSNHPMAPLANIPGVFSVLWTPEVAPTTALTLGTAGYGFAGVPKSLVHFTTSKAAPLIAESWVINATRVGLFGPGVYLTKIGRPFNLFVRANARVPITVPTPAGTARSIPKLVYVRWGRAGLPL